MARGVHQPEEAAPADAEHVDRTEPERLTDALDVGDQLILRALLDRHPFRAAVAAMIVEDQPEVELGRQRRESAREPGRVGARTAVQAHARLPLADRLTEDRRAVDA